MRFRTKYLLKSESGRVFDYQTTFDGCDVRLLTGTIGNMQEVAIDDMSRTTDSLNISCNEGDITIPLTRAVDLPIGVVPPKPMLFPRTADLPEVLYHADPQDAGHLMGQSMIPGEYAKATAANF